MTSKFLKIAAVALIICTSGPVLAQTADVFPLPAALERDVNFWVAIFSKYSTNEGVLHDNRNMAIVYETIALPNNASRRTRQRASGDRRKHYQSILRTLGNGKRDNLSAEEQRVLDLWPDDVTNKELAAAVGRIRFQLGLSDRFRDGLQRSGKWRDHVNAEFSRLGVPTELAALPHVESSYNPEARSHVGASGIWQFTRSTGRRFLQVDHVLDERNDPFLATTAAGKLLAYNYSITGNWPMAITAYNHGLSGARRAMRRHGDTAYVDILRNYNGRTFGFASRNFYVAFLAAMHIDQDPEKYFPGVVPDKPIDYSTYQLTAFVAADELASVLKVSERELARYNPALQATVWQGSKYLPKNYAVRMPANMLDASMSKLVGQIPADTLFDKQLPDLFHTVVRGDTLSEIADTYDTRVSTLVALNALGSRNRIRAGQQIRLPAAGPAPTAAVVAAAPTVAPSVAPAEPPALPPAVIADAPAIAAIVLPEEESPGALPDQVSDFIGSLQAALLSDPSDYSVGGDLTIEVQPLETLGHYADWLGLKTQRLRDINGMAFRAPVVVGHRIKLDFSIVNTESFENLRADFHRQQQDTFFRNHTITGVTEHVVRRGESIWILSLRKYDVPVWLFRQYNPELNLDNVQPGTQLNFPILVRNSSD